MIDLNQHIIDSNHKKYTAGIRSVTVARSQVFSIKINEVTRSTVKMRAHAREIKNALAMRDHFPAYMSQMTVPYCDSMINNENNCVFPTVTNRHNLCN